ncbi:hypothetical protein ACYSNR_17205, partial [Enterococcus sp. LJL128]
LNLRKLGKYMERKRREEEKTSPILTFIIKIELVFFLRVDYVPLPFCMLYNDDKRTQQLLANELQS